MKISAGNIKSLIRTLGFIAQDGTSEVYFKKYENHDYILKIDFNTEKIVYRTDDIPEEKGIRWGDATTSNFSSSENFVVLECVDRLLEKGYLPQNIYLEYKFPLGRNEKGKLDILVFDKSNKAYLMLECKTWGAEYAKEQKKMQKDGGQLFSYFIQDKAAKYLCLYTSMFSNGIVEYKNDIIKVDEVWNELDNVKEIHDHWNKNTKDNGVFEEWANAYDVEIKALVRSRLQPLTKDDSGRIFNQFAEILRHNVVSDKPNSFNKILNLFICKIIDEDKNESEQVEFQWLEDDTNETLQLRLNDLYKKGMHRFLDIEVTDFTESDISETLVNIGDSQAQKAIKDMIIKLRLQKNPEFAFIEVYNETSFKLNARVVKEVVELLQPYQFRYGHKQQFLGDFFELLLNTSIKQEAGQYFTPVPITRYIVSSMPIKEFVENKLKTDDPNILPHVIDFACGTGHFLTEFMDRVQTIVENEIDSKKAKPTARKKLHYWSGDDGKFEWASDYVYGIDADYRLVKSSKVSSFLNGDGEANIIRANGLDHFEKSKEYRGKLKEFSATDNKDNGQFDVLIANPPYSVSSFKSTVKYGEESFELFERLTDNSSEIECLFVERMKQLLKVGGYAGIILPSSILSNTGIYTATREILLKYFKVIAITEFGSNTFMATGTNTVALFLERRPNTDHKNIQNAINSFFERPKDVTVLGIEKAFSKYINYVFDGVSFEDYASFACKKITVNFAELEIYQDYRSWFDNLTDIKNLKAKKTFKELTVKEQQKKLDKLFYEKVFAIEKDKMLYFMLTYDQKTVITKVGEKQAEKEFIGYEFSNRRGHEGIKMLPNGTKLYDETGALNSEKANNYIYNAFKGSCGDISERLKDNIFYANTVGLLDFTNVQIEKQISLNSKKKQNIKQWIYEPVKIANILTEIIGSNEKTESSLINNQGNIPVISQNQEKFIDGYCDSNTPIDDLPIVLFGDHNCFFKYIDFPFVRGGDGTQLMKCSDDFIPKFFYEIVQSQKHHITNFYKYERHYKYLKELYVPLPPLDIQEKIVVEIGEVEQRKSDSLKKIDKAKNEISNILTSIFTPDNVKIKDIACINPSKPSRNDFESNMLVSFVEMASISEKGYIQKQDTRKFETVVVGGYTSFQVDDIIIAKITPCMENGKCALVSSLQYDIGFGSTEFHIIRTNKNLMLPKFLFLLLNREDVRLQAKGKMTGASGHKRVPQAFYEEFNIPNITLEKQQEIVSEIELLEKEIQLIEDELATVEERKKSILDKYLK